MSETATCAKCMYTVKFPYGTGEMVKIFFDSHDCDSTKLQQAIERVREFLDDTIRDGIGRAPEDPRTYFRLMAHQVARVLEGEQ